MSESLTSKWLDCLKIFKDIVELDHYKTWFEPIKPISLEHNVLTIEVPSHFFYEYIEKVYVSLIAKTLKRVWGIDTTLEYRIPVDSGSSNRNGKMILPTNNALHNNINTHGGLWKEGRIENPYTVPGLTRPRIDSQLNPSYTFDNYISGNCNKTFIFAGKKIAETPGLNTPYNPIVVYSQVGLGKTHLVHAIGNDIKRLHPNLTVLYVSCEKFINQFADHCQKRMVNDFIQFYQHVDVLILDDIQFFSVAEKSQDAFFAIFNHLHQSGKQLILTSDKAPKDLPNVDERLLSRFRWGLTGELTQPDFETKVKIINLKLKLQGNSNVDPDVINYIAENVNTNIRDLEGVLISLIVHSSSNDKEMDIRLAKKVLKNIVKEQTKELTIDMIHKVTCEHFDINYRKLFETTRKRQYVQARTNLYVVGKKIYR